MFLDLLVGKAMNMACKKICTPEPKLSAKHTFKIEDFQLKVKAFLNSSIDVSCEFEEYSSFFFFFWPLNSVLHSETTFFHHDCTEINLFDWTSSLCPSKIQA